MILNSKTIVIAKIMRFDHVFVTDLFMTIQYKKGLNWNRKFYTSNEIPSLTSYAKFYFHSSFGIQNYQIRIKVNFLLITSKKLWMIQSVCDECVILLWIIYKMRNIFQLVFVNLVFFSIWCKSMQWWHVPVQCSYSEYALFRKLFEKLI